MVSIRSQGAFFQDSSAKRERIIKFPRKEESAEKYSDCLTNWPLEKHFFFFSLCAQKAEAGILSMLYLSSNGFRTASCHCFWDKSTNQMLSSWWKVRKDINGLIQYCTLNTTIQICLERCTTGEIIAWWFSFWTLEGYNLCLKSGLASHSQYTSKKSKMKSGKQEGDTYSMGWHWLEEQRDLANPSRPSSRSCVEIKV